MTTKAYPAYCMARNDIVRHPIYREAPLRVQDYPNKYSYQHQFKPEAETTVPRFDGNAHMVTSSMI